MKQIISERERRAWQSAQDKWQSAQDAKQAFRRSGRYPPPVAVSNEVCEAALAHAIENKVEAAYRRGDLFGKRRQLMDAWATYCAAPKGKVVAFRR
jgi:hypothetical protein